MLTSGSILGLNMLTLIAEHADVQSVHILASTLPMKISYDIRVDSIAANLEILRKRRDYSDELLEAFEELIAIAKAEEGESGSIDSLVESGLFVSAKSTFNEELAEALAKLEAVAVSPTTTDSDGFEDCQEALIQE